MKFPWSQETRWVPTNPICGSKVSLKKVRKFFIVTFLFNLFCKKLNFNTNNNNDCSGAMFREWILTKIVNGERASYSAPKFARMQERTRSQILEDIVANLQNHAETGQIPKPYR